MASDTNQQYCQIASAIIEKQIGILGKEIALKKVSVVKDIVINDNGQVLAIYKPIEALEALIQEYKSISGDTAVHFCQDATEALLTKYPNLNVPTILKSQTSSMENFLSSF